MSNTILLKRSAVPGHTPTTLSLAVGELAINTYDGLLFLHQNNGTDQIVTIGAGGGGSTTFTGDVTGSGSGTVALTIAASGVTAGTYTKVTVNAKGQVTTGASLASGDVTTALGYTPLSANQTITISGDASGSGVTSIPITLATSGVTAGTYTKVTVNAKGLVTVGASLASGDVTTALGFTPYNATNPSNYLTANQTITLSGDVTGSGVTAITATLAASGVTAGTYGQVTVNTKGLVTAGTVITSVANGGTGLATIPANAVMLGNGTTQVQTVAPGTSGHILTSNGTIWTSAAPATAGTVTTISVASANGFAGSVANATSTPTISVSTSVTGLLKGNGTSVSAAVAGTDFCAATSGSSILYGDGAGGTTAVTIGSGLTFTSGTLAASGGGGSPFTTTQVFNGSTTAVAMRITNAAEIVYIVAAAPAATQTFYVSNGAVQFYTVAATATWIINFAFASGTSLNTEMTVGDSITVAMMATQGATPYYPTAFQVDGSGVTPKWQGGAGAPSFGNASGIDVYTFTIIKTASATYSIIAAQTQYK